MTAWAAGPAGEAFDEITGAVLPPLLVQQARAEEIKFMLDWGVWERAPISACWQETGRAPIGSKWVDVNKGDAVTPLIRSRFVVKEIATYNRTTSLRRPRLLRRLGCCFRWQRRRGRTPKLRSSTHAKPICMLTQIALSLRNCRQKRLRRGTVHG